LKFTADGVLGIKFTAEAQTCLSADRDAEDVIGLFSVLSAQRFCVIIVLFEINRGDAKDF
jgi:hypothetical protein